MIRFLKENTERSLLLMILFIGAILRFYNINGLSFSNEELSIITRIKELSFGDFFSLSNIGDTGPAGFYTLLYLWVKITGYSVFMIRLPFIICGILSIYYVYRIAEKWFNSHAALFAAATLCFLEYTLQFSQSARPFAPGLLFTLLSVWFWTKFLFDQELKRKNMIRFVLFFALAAYMHYFSMAFLVMVYISGFFFIRKKDLKMYLFSFLLTLVLFSPNIPVIIYQLINPGESWLTVPEQGWFFDYILYVFNGSYIVLYTVLAIFIISNIFSFTEIKFGKFHLLSLAWFVLPVVYGFYYSSLVRPVLEDSVLIFSFSFLLFFLFSFIRKEYRIYNYIALAALLIIGIFSTLSEKIYYASYTHGEFRDLAKKTIEWNSAYGATNITRVINVNSPSYINYYFDRFDNPVDFSLYKNDGKTDLLKLRKVIEASNAPYFLYAWSSVYNPSESDDMIRTKYPFQIKNIDYNRMAGISLYSVKDSSGALPISQPVYYALNGFENKNTWDKDTSILDTTIVKYGKYSVKLDAKDEYGPSSNSIISGMTDKSFTRVSVSLWAYAAGIFKDAQIVATLNFRDDDNQIYENYMWVSSKFEYFIEKEKWGQVFFSFTLPELRSRNDELKIYVWNPDRNPLYIDNIEIKAFEK
jgi:hypothetical protein